MPARNNKTNLRRQSPHNGKKKASVLRGRRPMFEDLENRRLLAVDTFQQGAGGYAGQEDTVLYSRLPEVNFGTEGSISPDQQDANGVRQGLVQFQNIFGEGAIPQGARINSATLTVNVVNDSNSAMQMSFYRMLEPWSEASATWNTFGAVGGVQASEGESSDLPPDGIIFDPDTTAESSTAGIVDVTTSLEYWSAGTENYGWMIESAATNGWDFRTKESAQAQRPRLVVDWTVPAVEEYKILNTRVSQAEGPAGETRTAIIEVARFGELDSASSISYSALAGTADGGDFVEIPNGTLNFAVGQGLATIEVTINGDDELEGLETIDVTLTSGNIVPGGGEIAVTIGDDDALINEVLANVSNNADETNREYIELIGTPGASLDDYYFVVFEGEEEGDQGLTTDGSSLGIADFVFDLSGLSFGANGLLVITPTNWEYASFADADTTIVTTDKLDGNGGVLEDFSQTYALIRSPNAAIVEGTDYDTVGFYEDATNQAIGVGVGILDQLPAGADVVDTVGVVEGGGGDRDRVLAAPELGNPGIHVHQPTPFFQGGNVTSDAVSRRIGETLPNSIGVWFNGDIPDGAGVNGRIPYINDSFFISVVAPDGSVLTPGSSNILRTVFFSISDQETEVAEADGSVTVTIERTGDLNEVIDVTYQTVNGSAVGGLDFVAVNETITFGVGETSKEVTIDLIPDDVAEGFERFDLEITAVTGGYLITNGRANQQGAVNGLATVTIADADVSTATFQNGVNGYTGTTDAYLDGEQTTTKFGQSSVIRVDQVKGEGEDTPPVVRPQQGLIRFDDLFGSGPNQVPAGSTIFGGFLTINVQNIASGADVRFFRMLQDWEELNATWLDPQGNVGNSIVNGVTPDNVEATSKPDGVVPDPGRAGLVEIPLDADTLQSWANGSDENYGWSIVSNAGSLWAFNSSEAFLTGTFRPELTILYTAPTADTGAFGLARDEFLVNEDGTATVTINRKGGSTGPATVDWAVTAEMGNTGSASDISGPLSGSVNFADGELFKTFDIQINDDSELETNETLTISLSGTGLDFSREEATLTIRDNDFSPFAGDLLLNELWINSPGNDPPHEFVELKGTAGIGLGSLYYVAFEGLIGDREGAAEKVVDLGQFSNGSNGFSLLTPDAADFAFNVPAGTTQIDGLGSIVTENVASQNDSTTYMLLYSPLTDLATSEFDYDWDNDGALELPLGVTIVDSLAVRVLGAADQLYGPSTNRAAFDLSDPEVDAVSRLRNDTQANRGTSWFGGDLFPAGDDYLLYETAEAFGLPVTGAALSPGEANVGTNAESPLGTLDNVTVNANGTVTVTFSDVVTQLNSGDGGTASPGGAGVTLTDTMGNILPTIDASPIVTGFGTNVLTLSFTGSGVTGGALPSGDYRLNFVGNAIISNARATDVAADGSQIDSFYSELITVSTTAGCDLDGDAMCGTSDLRVLYDDINAGTVGGPSDIDGNGLVENADIDAWLASAGSFNGQTYLPGDTDLDGSVLGNDFTALASGFGGSGLPGAYWDQGNFDGNTGGSFSVGGGDFTALASSFGTTAPTAVVVDATRSAATKRAATEPTAPEAVIASNQAATVPFANTVGTQEESADDRIRSRVTQIVDEVFASLV